MRAGPTRSCCGLAQPAVVNPTQPAFSGWVGDMDWRRRFYNLASIGYRTCTGVSVKQEQTEIVAFLSKEKPCSLPLRFSISHPYKFGSQWKPSYKSAASNPTQKTLVSPARKMRVGLRVEKWVGSARSYGPVQRAGWTRPNPKMRVESTGWANPHNTVGCHTFRFPGDFLEKCSEKDQVRLEAWNFYIL